MVFIWNWMTMKGWNGKKRDHLWISVHFHPHIFILVEFHLDIRNGPSNFRISFSIFPRSDFYKFLLKDEIVRIKMCISTISSWKLIGQISSWNLIGQNPHSYIILSNQHQECICFCYLAQFFNSWKVRQIQILHFQK